MAVHPFLFVIVTVKTVSSSSAPLLDLGQSAQLSLSEGDHSMVAIESAGIVVAKINVSPFPASTLAEGGRLTETADG